MPPDPFGSSDCGAAAIAQTNFTELVIDAPFDLPEVDLTGAPYLLPAQTGQLYTDVVQLTNADLTTGVIGGTGTFDIIMASTHAHLKGEFDKQRITGDQYAKAYIELTTAALGTASQFLLGRDQAYWAAILTQNQARAAEIQAVIAAVTLETAKAQLQIAYYEANRSEAEYALSKMKLATEDAQFCALKAQTETIRYNLDEMIPLQVAGVTIDNLMKTYQYEEFLPVQRDGIIADTAIKEYTLTDMLPQQKILLQEQTEVQRAQTMDTRSDGITTIVGSVGKQKDLYDQQIDSYIKDAQYKVGKLYTDGFIARYTINDATPIPGQYGEVEVDEVLTLLRTNNSLGS